MLTNAAYRVQGIEDTMSCSQAEYAYLNNTGRPFYHFPVHIPV